MLVTLPLDIEGDISSNPDYCPWRAFQSLIAERVVELRQYMIERCIKLWHI